MKIGSCGDEEPGATTDNNNNNKKKKWCVEAVHDGIICNQKICSHATSRILTLT